MSSSRAGFTVACAAADTCSTFTARTASSTGNVGSRGQRSVETRRGASLPEGWKRIGRRDGASTADQSQTCRVTDTDRPYVADSLAYRLEPVDIDGTMQATDPTTVERTGLERLQLKKSFPNPARSRVTLRYAVPEEIRSERVTVRLYDVIGRGVQTAAQGTEAGWYELQLSVDDLASGVCVLRLTAGQQTRTRWSMAVQ